GELDLPESGMTLLRLVLPYMIKGLVPYFSCLAEALRISADKASRYRIIAKMAMISPHLEDLLYLLQIPVNIDENFIRFISSQWEIPNTRFGDMNSQVDRSVTAAAI